MAELILITGGARSGKSNFAQKLCESFETSRAYIATCPAYDDSGDLELAARIEKHKKMRQNRGWETFEEQTDPGIIISRNPEIETFLLDCLTLWINNLMFVTDRPSLHEEAIQTHCLKLLDIVDIHQGTIIMVTNEVGYGIVPENETARLFRDLVGRCNQLMAARADAVYLVTCGIPGKIK